MRTFGILVKTYPKLSETFILEEILGLERLDVRLHLFSINTPSDDIAHSAHERVKASVTYLRPHFARCAGALLWVLLTHPHRLLQALLQVLLIPSYRLRDIAAASLLGRQLRAHSISHLHCHFINGPASIAHLASLLFHIPFSISAHAKDIYLSPPQALRAKLNAARFTVTCTQYNHSQLTQLSDRAGSVQRVYHGIDIEVFKKESSLSNGDQPLILAVGRLKRKKGFTYLIDACALLRERGVAFRCEIVGYGSEEHCLRTQIRERHLTSNVHLPGRMSRDEIVDRYRRASVFAMPCIIATDGDRDGIPNAALEAMAMELPVVTTPISGIPEVVEHRHNGYLVPPANALALADALQELLADDALRLRLGRAGRETVATTFNNDRNLQLVKALLEDSPTTTPTPSSIPHRDVIHAK